MRRNSANVTHFHGKRYRNLTKGAAIQDCGTLQDGALRRGHQSAALLWEKNGAHAAMFSSVTAACCCILFDVYRRYKSHHILNLYRLEAVSGPGGDECDHALIEPLS